MIRFRKIIQLAFLLVFALLIYKKKIQLWMLIFLLSAISAFIFGRFYCGWICPINTLMEVNDWIYKKLKIKRKVIPDFVKSNFIRLSILTIFVLAFILNNKFYKSIPILLILIILAILISFIYEPSLWHKYLCPFGIILNVPGKFSKHYLNVKDEKCIKCGACKSACPADAIKMENKNEFPKILKEYCLECTACIKACKKDAIKYV